VRRGLAAFAAALDGALGRSTSWPPARRDLAAASTAHADAPQRPDGAPGSRTLDPQPEPPGILHDACAAARLSLIVDGVQIAPS
jgi:hypothetical protein